MLYPNTTVVLTATTLDTATKMVKNKMEGELCGNFSQKLKYLKQVGQIKFYYNDRIEVKFIFNDSKILVLPENENSAGERSNFLIFEEIRLSRQNIINRIFMPMRYTRPAGYRLRDEYKKIKVLREKAQVIHLTSTSYTFEWWFEKWKTCVVGFFSKFSKLKYGIFCGDIITSIAHGFTTEEEFQAEIDDPTVSQEQIDMEYYNEPQGGIEGAFYNMQKMKENSIVQEAFIPPTYEDFISKYDCDRTKIFRSKGYEETRAIVVDFASTDTVNKEQANDNTIIICMSGSPNKEKTKIVRSIDRIESFSGGDKDNTLKRIRELFYFYQADVFIFDNRQVGEDRFQDLSKSYYHEELGMEMSGFGIMNDESITKNFCKSDKISNLMTKVVDKNAMPITIPVVGLRERNHNYHVAMQNAINSKKMLFLEDLTKARNRLEKHEDWMFKDSVERENILRGNVNTNLLLIEASELQKDIKDGFYVLTEIPHHPKDRIITAIYGNYYFSLLEIKMLQNQQNEEELDWENIQLVF